MYSEKVLEIFKNPPHAGGLQASSGVGKYVDEVSGDQIKIYIKTKEDVIVDSHFKTLGSVASIVCSSVLCSNLIGLTIKEAEDLDESIILNNIDLPADKEYVAIFVLNALKLAIENYYKEKEKEEKEGKSKTAKAKSVKKQVSKEAKEYAEEVKEKLEEDEDNKQVSKTKKAFEEMFSAWED